jgi:hypothetical protein
MGKILALVDALGNLVRFRLMPGKRGKQRVWPRCSMG